MATLQVPVHYIVSAGRHWFTSFEYIDRSSEDLLWVVNSSVCFKGEMAIDWWLFSILWIIASPRIFPRLHALHNLIFPAGQNQEGTPVFFFVKHIKKLIGR